MSQGPLCPWQSHDQKIPKEIANHDLSLVMLLGDLSVNLNLPKSIVMLTDTTQY